MSASSSKIERKEGKIEEDLLSKDSTSNANLGEVRTRHIHLDGEISFEKKQFIGSARLTLLGVGGGETSSIVLDGNSLQITAVENASSSAALNYVVADAILGQSISIDLDAPLKSGDKVDVLVRYATSPEASGMQWLTPVQTEGKKHPYLYTQFEAIHARSFMPCQDSPAVKLTYSATVRVAKPLVPLMSAIMIAEPEDVEGGALQQHSYEQPTPIPSYLVALAVGHLESRELSDRSRVWAEPSIVGAAAHEFAECEQFLTTLEKLLTPYEWGRYDILVLPPPSPFGGMEHACMTFVTPTLLAGDRSLANVVIHEATHSWSGNLVTTRTFDDFWLNEGFTVFIERKAIAELQGEAMRQFSIRVGLATLQTTVDHYGADSPFTALYIDLQGQDPDDAFSSVPYERGSAFLFYLETVVGADRFGEFLREWFTKHMHGTVTTQIFRDHFLAFFAEQRAAIDAKVDWDAWLNGTGMPPVDIAALLDNTLWDASAALAERWLSGDDTVSAADIEGWATGPIVAFFEQILLDKERTLTIDRLKHMNELYKFAASRNAEIRFRWLMAVLRCKHTDAYPDVVAMLKEQGRMKFTRPLYRELYAAAGDARQLALDTFNEWRQNYHNICAKMVAKDLHLE
jgi:leukotriene A-4 hydrolase/aminopeptidase